ncbi:DUF2795 domain-containing protein [Streptomyces sp. JJ36]|uniref:DUF2795 domain-containing protein n=1 Tax=Streptomyces sp. JJ36 TaxID=2736645 RepID=UPI001F3C931C|nr:DUF2795 domain-containing protein [Streptomyces sp. JJ36]MCF6525377.1 DUF2795 domain-containing protein [Streptomyces sp. JJ36]
MASEKTGPLHDDEMKKELQGELKAEGSVRAQEEHELQPAGEDQPEASLDPEGPLHGGTPPGMDAADVELRSELARHLSPGIYPADRAAVLASLRENHAPDRLLSLADDLPEGEYRNVQDLARALGLGVEDHRT